jgi:hypothetical protein
MIEKRLVQVVAVAVLGGFFVAQGHVLDSMYDVEGRLLL